MCRKRHKRAEDGMRMEDIMAEWKIKTVPYAFPVQARWSLLFFLAAYSERCTSSLSYLFGRLIFFRAFRGSSLIDSGAPQPGCAHTNTVTTQKLALNAHSAIKEVFTHVLMFPSDHQEGNVLRVYCTGLNARKKPRESARETVNFCADAVSDAAKRQLEEMSWLFLKYQSDRN